MINYFCKVSNDNMDNSKDLFLVNRENVMKGSLGYDARIWHGYKYNDMLWRWAGHRHYT